MHSIYKERLFISKEISNDDILIPRRNKTIEKFKYHPSSGILYARMLKKEQKKGLCEISPCGAMFIYFLQVYSLNDTIHGKCQNHLVDDSALIYNK